MVRSFLQAIADHFQYFFYASKVYYGRLLLYSIQAKWLAFWVWAKFKSIFAIIFVVYAWILEILKKKLKTSGYY